MFPESIFDDVKAGRVVIVTGAGVSLSSKNSKNKEIIGSRALAKEIARAANLSYSDSDDIKDVFEAANLPAGTAKFKRILEDNFLNTAPSAELMDLYSFPWRRAYTFNIDDTVERIPFSRRAQKLRAYNALSDRREEWRGYEECQYIHLHGYVGQLDKGIIFSAGEYASAGASTSAWYTQLGEDFIDYTVVFVGTSLEEQVLFQAIKQSLVGTTNSGHSYCITPDDLSEIRRKSLENRGIVHIKAAASEFVKELKRRFPQGLQPRQIQSDSVAAAAEQKYEFTDQDVEALRSIYPISRSALKKRYSPAKHPTAVPKRRYYEGYGPSWPVIMDDAYAKLGQYVTLSARMDELRRSHRAIVILGEAGAGKSTFLHHYALQVADSDTGPVVFEYVEGTESLRKVMQSLKRYTGGKEAIVFTDAFHVLAEDISDILADDSMSNVCVIAGARSSEWHDRLGKFFGGNCVTLPFQRFSSADIPQIIAAVEANYAAPEFNKLPYAQKVERFKRSNQQLLIALMEATSSQGFREIIEDEFKAVRDEEQRRLLLVCSAATVPRIGVEKSMAAAIMADLGVQTPVSRLLEGLSGIVDVAPNGRLQARHQLYAAEIVQKHVSVDDYCDVLYAMIEYYSKYSAPIMKHLSKMDGQLFKYLLNNWNVFQLFKTSGELEDAETFYSRFEVLLQLDGHFWLQYALLLRRLGKQGEALKMLVRSIEAYPANVYAHHALAQQKLIQASQQKVFTQATARLIDEAVSALLERHHAMQLDRALGATDEYPIVALGFYHVDALMAHARVDEAQKAARQYFAEIEKLIKRSNDPMLREIRSRLLLLATSGEWRRLKYRVGSIGFEAA
jgi:hypothetical protein